MCSCTRAKSHCQGHARAVMPVATANYIVLQLLTVQMHTQVQARSIAEQLADFEAGRGPVGAAWPATLARGSVGPHRLTQAQVHARVCGLAGGLRDLPMCVWQGCSIVKPALPGTFRAMRACL